MEIEVGNFAIYKFQVVTVERIINFEGKLGKSAVFKYCARDKNCRPQDQETTVLLSELTPFTQKTAEELTKRYNKMIGKCNIQLHAINDCLGYM